MFPALQCVVNNGDGTYTAYFGYINLSSSTIVIPFDPSFSKNMFTSNSKYRGQPDTFLPGTHDFVFSVVFASHNGSPPDSYIMPTVMLIHTTVVSTET